MSREVLRTARLVLHEWSDADRAFALALWNDPVVMQFLGGPFGGARVDERLATEARNLREHGVQYWPVQCIDGGAHAGVCGLKPYRPAEKILELGFHFLPAYWGAGYASEAAHAVVMHAFDTLGVAQLFAGHHPDNLASKRVLEKLGFRYAFDEYFPPTGRVHPGYLLDPERARK